MGGEVAGTQAVIDGRRSPDGGSSTDKFQTLLRPKSKSPTKATKSQTSRCSALLRTTKKVTNTERRANTKFTATGPRPPTAQVRPPSPVKQKTKKKSTAAKKGKPQGPPSIPHYSDLKSKVLRNYYTTTSTISTKEATLKPRPTSPSKKAPTTCMPSSKSSRKLSLSET